MAEGPDPTGTEIGHEVAVDENGDIISSTQHAGNAETEYIRVVDTWKCHPDNVANAENPIPSYYTRLRTGNTFSSGCSSIIKSMTGGAQYIGHQVIQDYYEDSPTILNSSITDTCKHILKTVRKFNGHNNILLQGKWLDETEYLLKKKVLTIGVFGRHKAGKSTLLNALLHHEVLSVADTNETAFILRIDHKPSDHHGSSCFEDTERFLFMKEEEAKGRQNIRKTIKRKNSDIREKAATICITQVVAHVPFLCRCATGDIKIVLLDTPGLSESNELGISEVSEHQLMTCAVYVYVISCKQLEDSIDTDSLRAIVMRDPNVFKEGRILIAVTRLDEFNNPTSQDESDSDSDSDDESRHGNNEEEILKRIHSIKEVIQRQFKCLGVPIPDDCIIPLCATGALKARKKVMNLKVKKKEPDPDQESKLSAAKKREKISQVLLLEEKLIEIAGNCHYLWHYNIVRDCTRYCDQAMEKLDETKEGFIELEMEFNNKVKKKEDNLQDFETLVKNFRSKYADESEFFKQLEVTYDEDLKANHEIIDKVSRSHLTIFEKFQSEIKERRPRVTTAQFNSEAKNLFENENKSLRNELKDLPFKQMDVVVKDSVHRFGSTKQRLKQYLAAYCNTTTSASDESHLPEDHIITESVSDSRIPVSSSPPLKLRDVLEQSEV